jgi:hypothetical protein
MRQVALKSILSNLFIKILQNRGYTLEKYYPSRDIHKSRFEYQKRYITFSLNKSDRILDVGSGGDPFPYATILAERYLHPSRHRSSQFRAVGKPVVICDINRLPFKTGAFDYVFCSHVLEHVEDPITACYEIMRVGKKGYIETPHFMSDALFSWAKGMHKWFVQSIGNRLVFFEYDERRSEGIRSPAWHDVIFRASYHPLQDVFADNKDLFTVMFPWEGEFFVDVYYLDGRTHHSKAEK